MGCKLLVDVFDMARRGLTGDSASSSAVSSDAASDARTPRRRRARRASPAPGASSSASGTRGRAPPFLLSGVGPGAAAPRLPGLGPLPVSRTARVRRAPARRPALARRSSRRARGIGAAAAARLAAVPAARGGPRANRRPALARRRRRVPAALPALGESAACGARRSAACGAAGVAAAPRRSKSRGAPRRTGSRRGGAAAAVVAAAPQGVARRALVGRPDRCAASPSWPLIALAVSRHWRGPGVAAAWGGESAGGAMRGRASPSGGRRRLLRLLVSLGWRFLS